MKAEIVRTLTDTFEAHAHTQKKQDRMNRIFRIKPKPLLPHILSIL